MKLAKKYIKNRTDRWIKDNGGEGLRPGKMRVSTSCPVARSFPGARSSGIHHTYLQDGRVIEHPWFVSAFVFLMDKEQYLELREEYKPLSAPKSATLYVPEEWQTDESAIIADEARLG